MARLLFKNNNFIFLCSFQERIAAKAAGFRWDAENKIWYTKDAGTASRLREYADSSAETEIKRKSLIITPWTEALSPPPEGLSLYPHQEDAIQFALERNRCYLGLDPGLGKTIVAARVALELKIKSKFVYICPPFLVKNVVTEFGKWAPELSVSTYESFSGKRYPPHPFEYDVFVVPDSLIFENGFYDGEICLRSSVAQQIKEFVNDYPMSVLFVDEAHRFKNEEAKRTRALLGYKDVEKGNISGIVDWFSKIVLMSGTPMPNRPIELYPVLSKLVPQTIAHMNRFVYGMEYCAGFQERFGWNFLGASNVDKLAKRVIHPSGPFMLRMKKELLDLPPKLEEIFSISDETSQKLQKMENQIKKVYTKTEDLIKARIAKSEGKESAEDLHLATYRRLLGAEKAPHAVEYISSLLEETDESILVFAIHKDTISELAKGFKKYDPVVVTGATPVKERQRLVDQFQTEQGQRLFIGNIQAAGVGFTLTKATRVVFVEFSWVPGENNQASDRAHRIGQKSSVLVQYMVYEHSIDKKVIEILLKKSKSIQQM